MKKFVLMGALAATLSLSLVPRAFAEPNSAGAEPSSDVIDQYSKGLGADSVSQVSSVSELTDVDPNSWAFQALKSLVERYGCIEGYPNKKYLGNRPLSRYEFAAGLNSCLDKIGEQIAAAVADKATKDDLAAVQRLQEEFKVELATLRGRVDALEAKTKELEAQQFSTTTKLDGSVVMAIQGGSAGGNVQISPTSYTTTTPFVGVNGGVVPAGTVLSTSVNGYGPATFGNVLPGFPATAGGIGSLPGLTANNLINLPGSSANTTFFGRTTLNFRASFTGKDELLIRLRGVTGQDIGGTFQGIAGGLGTAFYAGGPNGAYDQSSIGNVQTNGNSNVSFDKVRYTTTLFSDNFRIFVGPRIDIFEILDTNSFANNEEVDFSNGSLINNPLITFIFAGPGTGFDWKIADAFSFRGAYIAGQGGNSNGFGFGGLTGSNSIGSLELEFRPSQTSKIKLQYGAYTTQTSPAFAPTKSNVYGVNAEWAITPGIGVFGRYGAGTATTGLLTGPGGGQIAAPNFNLTYYSFGFSFPDLFAPGNTLGIAAGQPIRATNIATGSEFDIEAYYNFKLNDRVTLTPDIQIISNPNNISGNGTLTVGTLRAVFSF